jgi:hypothetical protein
MGAQSILIYFFYARIIFSKGVSRTVFPFNVAAKPTLSPFDISWKSILCNGPSL